MSVKFRATLLQSGKTATGMEVPPAVVDSLGAGRRPPVRVTINGFTYRSSIAVMGGVYMLGVNADNRAGAGVAAGDVLDVEIEVDTEPREVELPEDFAAALGRDAGAKRFFEGLNYSNQRRLVEPIATIKGAEARERRIEKTVAMLREGRS